MGGRRSGEQNVLGLPAPQRAQALLPENPAERVREIALAAAVRSDDGGNAGLEIELGSLAKRLESVNGERA